MRSRPIGENIINAENLPRHKWAKVKILQILKTQNVPNTIIKRLKQVPIQKVRDLCLIKSADFLYRLDVEKIKIIDAEKIKSMKYSHLKK